MQLGTSFPRKNDRYCVERRMKTGITAVPNVSVQVHIRERRLFLSAFELVLAIACCTCSSGVPVSRTSSGSFRLRQILTTLPSRRLAVVHAVQALQPDQAAFRTP